MGSLVCPKRSNIRIDFYYRGIRCRESTGLPDTPQNRRRAERVLKQIEAEITLNRFDYARYFPNSSKVALFKEKDARIAEGTCHSITFEKFSRLWFEEKKIEWRTTTQSYSLAILEKDLIPFFGKKPVETITKTEILQFRSLVGERPGQKNAKLGASRVNRIMNLLRMIIEEAADRYEFKSPWRNIRQLQVRRQDIQPFSLQETMMLIDNVRADYRNYLTVRFFTGMRSGEINGLFWSDVDFSANTINVTKSFSSGEIIPTKTDGSRRAIWMNEMVQKALEQQQGITGEREFVFCSPQGLPIDNRNFRRRVWLPLLRYLGFEVRSPYQTRHTAATLWLSAGESPEWIARQMGHTTTEMLFRVYSRYVPNLTRRDGSAFEAVLQKYLVGRK